MAIQDKNFRLMNIVQFLRSKPKGANFKEILKHLEELHHKESFSNDLASSQKTFKRDLELLLELGIEIKFKRSTMTYQIIEDRFSDHSQTIFDNLLLINAYKQAENNSEIMIFEKRQASGLHNLEGLVFAIKNSKIITFNYTKNWEGISTKRVVEPYALKEFKNRWYLLANEVDGKDLFIKTFGLDRISDLEISTKLFSKQDIDVNEMFVNSFGIISTLGQKPEIIVLSFDYEQGKFVKSLPIHHSQKVLIDNDSEYRIELTLAPTYDFYQELLTHAGRMKILAPFNVKKEYFKLIDSAKN
ncbi:helix-turn-helix transcriptional regulator [Epilithonimonas xixisoli]|uniref:Putative DNA-binding transcriptional regulator YafY n=1 Tax=Epilithonimonas xixisoli TaxID=1476462 RepID=A0A4R8IBL9_9FLAO|nr:WYL domain-containing protein [Epilithonimonas xixisoli]TDX87094.1 putative DNA-binding transcriptional regulator YafY [Epilithonimonas xixisoli]